MNLAINLVFTVYLKMRIKVAKGKSIVGKVFVIKIKKQKSNKRITTAYKNDM